MFALLSHLANSQAIGKQIHTSDETLENWGHTLLHGTDTVCDVRGAVQNDAHVNL